MEPKRQVIMLMTDTTRQDMLGCYGNKNMYTPHLDKLAERGICYTNAYSCQPVCGPARSAIFTGLYPHSNGAVANSMPLGDNVKTIGQRLTDQGIHSAYIGKYHLDGGDYFGLGRCPEGWDADYWYDMKCYLDELNDEERIFSRQMKSNQLGVKAEFTYGHRCADRAINFIERYAEEDFFLTVSLDEPHGPSLCPEPYASMYKDYEFPKAPNVWDSLEGKPEYQKVWAGEGRFKNRDEVRIKLPDFLGCNSFADSELGRVLEAIYQKLPDALIIYTSDHGEGLESHCLNSKGPSMYNEIARIPMIVSGKNLPQGIVDSQPVSHINLVPTILEYMGLPIPKMLEGSSLLSAFYNPNIRINEYVVTEFTRYEVDHDGFGGLQIMRGIFDGRYKLVIHLLDDIDEFYDQETDPYEMNNLIMNPLYDEQKLRLHEALLEMMNRTRDPFRGYYWERRAWRRNAQSASWDYTGYTRQRENEEYEPRQLDYDTGLPMIESVRKKN